MTQFVWLLPLVQFSWSRYLNKNGKQVAPLFGLVHLKSFRLKRKKESSCYEHTIDVLVPDQCSGIASHCFAIDARLNKSPTFQASVGMEGDLPYLSPTTLETLEHGIDDFVLLPYLFGVLLCKINQH